jgi:hypothetical protein
VERGCGGRLEQPTAVHTVRGFATFFMDFNKIHAAVAESIKRRAASKEHKNMLANDVVPATFDVYIRRISSHAMIIFSCTRQKNRPPCRSKAKDQACAISIWCNSKALLHGKEYSSSENTLVCVYCHSRSNYTSRGIPNHSHGCKPISWAHTRCPVRLHSILNTICLSASKMLAPETLAEGASFRRQAHLSDLDGVPERFTYVRELMMY